MSKRQPLMSDKIKKAIKDKQSNTRPLLDQLIQLEKRLETFSTHNGDNLEKIKAQGLTLYSLRLNIKERILVSYSSLLKRYVFLDYLPKHEYHSVNSRQCIKWMRSIESAYATQKISLNGNSLPAEKLHSIKELSFFSGRLLELSAHQSAIFSRIYPILERGNNITVLLTATAGTGKTLLISLLINALLDNFSGSVNHAPVYYVTPKEKLRLSLRSEMNQNGHAEGFSALPYHDLVNRVGGIHLAPSMRAFEKTLEGEADVFFSRSKASRNVKGRLKYNAKKNTRRVEVRELSIQGRLSEFRVISAIFYICQTCESARHVYLGLPKSYSTLSIEEREACFESFNRIQSSLLRRNEYDPEFMSAIPTQADFPQPAAIFVDEAQCLSSLQLLTIYRQFDRVVMVGDRYQQNGGLNDKLSLVQYLITYHHAQKKQQAISKKEVFQHDLFSFMLCGSYRLPPLIAAVSQEIVTLMQRIKVDRKETVVSSAIDSKISTISLDYTQKALQLVKGSQYVLSLAYVCANEIPEISDYPRVFTPSQIGGLEYDVVVIFVDDIISKKNVSIFRSVLHGTKSHVKNISSDSKSELIDCLQDFFVACTRTTAHLVFSLRHPNENKNLLSFINDWIARSPFVRENLIEFDPASFYFSREPHSPTNELAKKHSSVCAPHSQIGPNPFGSLKQSLIFEIGEEKKLASSEGNEVQLEKSRRTISKIFAQLLDQCKSLDDANHALSGYALISSQSKASITHEQRAALIHHCDTHDMDILAGFLEDTEQLDLLIKAGARWRSSDVSIEFLFDAIQVGNHKLVKLLLAAGADINLTNCHGQSMLELFIQGGASWPSSDASIKFLFNAIESKNHKVIKLLLAAGVDVNQTDSDGRSMLEVACRLGDSFTVDLLLERPEINVNIRHNQDLTPLFTAVYYGHKKIVELLLNTDKVNLTLKSKVGFTALDIASLKGFGDIVTLLLSKNVLDTDESDELFTTSFTCSIRRGHTHIAWLLIDYMTNHSSSSCASNPDFLAIAIEEEKKEIAQLLLDKTDIDINSTTQEGFAPLWYACSNGNIELVQLLIKAGSDINKRNRNGETALFVAAFAGHAHVIKFLLSHDHININAFTVPGVTALSAAVNKGHITIVEMLLAMDNINIDSGVGNSRPTWFAIRSGNADILKLLLSKKNMSPSSISLSYDFLLSSAISLGQQEILNMLLKDESIEINLTNPHGYTLLYRACAKGNVGIVQSLLHAGASVNIGNNAGISPLSVAAKNGNIELVKLLLRVSDIDINKVSHSGMTCFSEAVSHGHTDIVAVLLKNGADFNVRTSNYLPLDIAVRKRYTKIEALIRRAMKVAQKKENKHGKCQINPSVNRLKNLAETRLFEFVREGMLTSDSLRSLLKMKADISCSTFKGRKVNTFPLLCAVRHNNEYAVQLLLGFKANPNQSTNVNEFTPLLLAANMGHTKIVKLLLHEPTDINQTGPQAKTPLLTASENGHTDIVKLLLARPEIDINSASDQRLTPLSTAAVNGHDEIVRLLLNCENIDVNMASFQGYTPLCMAACTGRSMAVQILLNHKDVDINLGSYKDNFTPLCYATQNGHEGVVRSLLCQKSLLDIDVELQDGSTPLCIAVKYNRLKIAQLLIGSKASVNHRKRNDITPICIAAGTLNISMLRLLVSKGALLETENMHRVNPLVFACAKHGGRRIVRFLLNSKACINQQDDRGHTAVFSAAGSRAIDSLQLLLEMRADCNIVSNKRETPLFNAVKHGCLESVRLLLNRDDVQIDVPQENGLTPLAAAIQTSNQAIQSLLIEKKADVNHAKPTL